MSDISKTKKPANTAFKQQRLKAWQPILTPKTVLPAFFLVGAVFIPLGIGLYIASERVNEISFDYTKCRNSDVTGASGHAPIVSWSWDGPNNNCNIVFEVPETFKPPVFMYYRLTNFYQNHRRYVKSFDAKQLKGNAAPADDKTCTPLTNPDPNEHVVVNGVNQTVGGASFYYPCGLIANSMFSDDISNLTCVQSATTQTTCATTPSYPFYEKGIAWPTDGDRFKQTNYLQTITNDTLLTMTLIPPPLWRTAFPQFKDGYTRANFPDIHTWERFQVWMRTAALPTFRKLWGRNLDDTLYPGTWSIVINDTFDVTRFSGSKSIVISTVSILGGKNPFLGIAYMTVGVICWVLGLIFLLRHMIKPRKLGDHTYLSWNQPSAAPQNEVRGPETSVAR
ncbi:hypothetical protein HKX48_000477 [Thoreauomyces humboldtii]|nr:hypothetical protein HKX48_000477 [Thoreauomyces humboldtii]